MCCFNKANLSAILLVHKRIIKFYQYMARRVEAIDPKKVLMSVR